MFALMDTEEIKTKLLAKRNVNELTGCWIWAGHVMPYNYGTTRVGRKTVVTHRLAYEVWVGPIPEGLILRHKCDNPRCFNPEHLRPGTQAENNLDCVRSGRHAQASQTHCKRGHEFTPENTKKTKAGRACIACIGTHASRPARPDFKTHCKRGHERTPENTYQEPNGGKKCRKCMRIRLNKRRQAILKLMKTNPEQVGFRDGDKLPEEPE